MRIISKFKDYYDNVQKYGVDSRPVFVRNTKEIDTKEIKCHDIGDADLKLNVKILDNIINELPRDFNFGRGVIAFCGVAYPFYERCNLYSNSRTNYNIEQMIKTLQMDNQKDLGLNISSLITKLNSTPKKKSYRRYYNRFFSNELNRTTWELYKQEATLVIPDSVFMYFSAPIILRTERELILNPRLNQYNFMTQVDPYTAYQELSMYIGNNLAVQMDPEVNISDKIRAESKGFDKWSFRRHKDESKKNK